MLRALVILLSCAACLVSSGCAAFAALPLVAAGASAGEAGYTFWDSGTLTYVDEATFEQMSAAVRSTNTRLSLQVESDVEETLGVGDGEVARRTWRLRTNTKRLLQVRIREMTDTMSGVSIDCGTFGNRSAARLYADRLKLELASIRERER